MRKYYTRPCNFYYGNYARNLVKNKKALTLTGNPNIAFDQLEIFQRKKKGVVKSNIYPTTEIKALDKEIKSIVKTDLKKITSKKELVSNKKKDVTIEQQLQLLIQTSNNSKELYDAIN